MGKLHLLKIVLVAFVILNVLIYKSLPKTWKNKLYKKIILISFHTIGCIGLTSIFLYFKYLPDGFIKQMLLTIGSLDFVYTMYLCIIGIILFIIYFIMKLLKCTKNKFYKHLCRMTYPAVGGIIVAFVIAVVGVVRMLGPIHITPYNIDTKKNTTAINALLLADLHLGCGMSNDRLNYTCDLLNALNPDVVLIVGDIFDETTSDENIENFIKSFRNVKTKYGSYFCYGNHDIARKDDIIPAMQKANITILENDSKFINDININIIGHGDVHEKEKDVSTIIKDTNLNLSYPTILLHHDPKYLEKFKDTGVDLVLCGHTHGQRYPLEYYPVLIFAKNFPIYGMAMFDKMIAITTSGASCWGVHYKFPSINEIVKLSIK